MRRDTPYPSIFSPNKEKYGPEITPYLDTFRAVLAKLLLILLSLQNENMDPVENAFLASRIIYNKFKLSLIILLR